MKRRIFAGAALVATITAAHAEDKYEPMADDVRQFVSASWGKASGLADPNLTAEQIAKAKAACSQSMYAKGNNTRDADMKQFPAGGSSDGSLSFFPASDGGMVAAAADFILPYVTKVEVRQAKTDHGVQLGIVKIAARDKGKWVKPDPKDQMWGIAAVAANFPIDGKPYNLMIANIAGKGAGTYVRCN